jgi:hypothetical protein
VRRLLGTLVAVALAAAPSTALAMEAQTGEYHGTSSTHGAISFSLNRARTLVTNFRISGHIFLVSAPFMHSPSSLGHFGAVHNGVHLWGAWKVESYPYAVGGYSYDQGGTHHVSHWSARIP